MDSNASGRRVTKRTVFWSGVGVIVVALVMLNYSQLLHVYSRSVDGAYDLIVAIIDVAAITAIVAGCVAIVVCHWFPDPRRKYSWRRPTRLGR